MLNNNYIIKYVLDNLMGFRNRCESIQKSKYNENRKKSMKVNN